MPVGDLMIPPSEINKKKVVPNRNIRRDISTVNGGGFAINSDHVGWLLALSDTDGTSNVSTNIKEQNSDGLEALGDVVSDSGKSSPMDEGADDFSKDAKAAETSSDTAVTDDSSNDETDDASKDDDTADDDSTPEDGETDEENVDESSENDVDDGSNASSPDASSDNSTDDSSDEQGGDISQDPHLSLNRRILISNKYLELYDRIKNSMEVISNGPAFDNKPVILESLGRLAEDVQLVNGSINKEPDHQVLLLKYSVFVKVYSKIIGVK